MTKRCVIYSRVSGDDRAKEGRNLASQLDDGRAYCQEKGYRIVAELAEDDRGASGADWDLPEMTRALEMARAKEFDVLVTRELDRFARDLAKQLVIEREFKQCGVAIEYVIGEYPDTPEGRLNKHIRASIAEFEKDLLVRRMARGRRSVVKSDKVMLHGDRPPYGYRVDDGKLVLYEPEARIIRSIFRWYVIGDEHGKKLGTGEIAQKLTKMGIPTWADTHNPNFYKVQSYGEWHKGTVRKLLSREVYIGKWTYKQGPKDQWASVEVLPIITHELWEAAQKQKVRNRELAKRNAKYPYLLRGRLFCGLCGSRMTGGSNGKRFYYACPRAIGKLVGESCDCQPKYIRADFIDAGVWEWLEALAQDPECAQLQWEQQWERQEEELEPIRKRLVILDDLLGDNQRQLEKLLDLYLSGDFDKAVLTDRKARLETTIAKLEKERGILLETITAKTRPIEDFDTVIERIATGFEKMGETPEKRRQLIDDLDLTMILTADIEKKIMTLQCQIKGGIIETPSPRSWAL